ncbi:cysteine--tRNA ligase [Candidatus Poribacteria bacterium]|jgi:cysteinyl-tRNA synthetase|nr:cysteine--tRNA ligase [Candidatus Poribacteria bacterium]MBT7807804.1 cysteine--tRNA ligase [Candidatus Poribacteria bacterium]
MAIRVHNTLTRRMEDFVPLTPGKVNMYCCGPTVYDYQGIHNARTFVTFDVIRRYLTHRGYDVTFAQNVTDIDDKIIQRAQENDADALEWAAKYAGEYAEDMAGLGVLPPDVAPRATETVPEMQSLITQLMDGDAAYETSSGVYYRVESFDEYGKLSNRSADDVRVSARIDVDEEKRDPRDFALWKRAKIGEPWWDSPWGRGRPGWHIECSAMVMKYFGTTADIHAGGADLIFPHHENEIAQSEKATGVPFARYWLHGALLRVGGEKMGKSLGNFITVRDAVAQYPTEAIRLFYLSTHYRKPLDYTPEAIAENVASARRLNRCVDALAAGADDAAPAKGGEPLADAAAVELVATTEAAAARFIALVDDDFNFAGGLGVLFEFTHAANRFVDENAEPTDDARRAMATAAAFLDDVMGAVLGIRAGDPAGDSDRLSGLVSVAVVLRHQAREAKEWEQADRVRDALGASGVTLQDGRDGSGWELEAGVDEAEACSAIVDLVATLRVEARERREWDTADALRDALAQAGVQLLDTREGTKWEWSDG